MTGPYRDLGDGPPCPESVMHGRTYVLARPDGTELCWCPVDGARFALIGGHDAGERLTGRPPSPMLRSATQHANTQGDRP